MIFHQHQGVFASVHDKRRPFLIIFYFCYCLEQYRNNQLLIHNLLRPLILPNRASSSPFAFYNIRPTASLSRIIAMDSFCQHARLSNPAAINSQLQQLPLNPTAQVPAERPIAHCSPH